MKTAPIDWIMVIGKIEFWVLISFFIFNKMIPKNIVNSVFFSVELGKLCCFIYLWRHAPKVNAPIIVKRNCEGSSILIKMNIYAYFHEHLLKKYINKGIIMNILISTRRYHDGGLIRSVLFKGNTMIAFIKSVKEIFCFQNEFIHSVRLELYHVILF